MHMQMSMQSSSFKAQYYEEVHSQLAHQEEKINRYTGQDGYRENVGRLGKRDKTTGQKWTRTRKRDGAGRSGEPVTADKDDNEHKTTHTWQGRKIGEDLSLPSTT